MRNTFGHSVFKKGVKLKSFLMENSRRTEAIMKIKRKLIKLEADPLSLQ